jgi:hypothetical protein
MPPNFFRSLFTRSSLRPTSRQGLTVYREWPSQISGQRWRVLKDQTVWDHL